MVRSEAAKVDDPHAHWKLAAVFVQPTFRGVVPEVIDAR